MPIMARGEVNQMKFGYLKIENGVRVMQKNPNRNKCFPYTTIPQIWYQDGKCHDVRLE